MTSRKNKSNLFRLTALLAVFAVGITAILGTSTNGGPRPQVLTFGYSLVTVSDPTVTIGELEDGTRTISSMLSSPQCTFAVDEATAADYRLNGQLGQSGTNAKIESINPTNASSTNTGGCGTVELVLILIGSRTTTLSLGTEHAKTKGDITVDGNAFSSISGYFRASVDSYDSSDRHMTGEFEFLAKQTGASGYIAVTGSFGGSP